MEQLWSVYTKMDVMFNITDPNKINAAADLLMGSLTPGIYKRSYHII